MRRLETDMLVIGSGPAGQKAAIQGAKAGRRVAMVERAAGVGGECVHRGTIPSKTLRETAATLLGFQRRTGSICQVSLGADLRLQSLMTRLDEVVNAHTDFIKNQITRNDIHLLHGCASFVSPHEVHVQELRDEIMVQADHIFVATGSRPRMPDDIDIDHEHILDSDSILGVDWLPSSLIVIGSGVIASEYASVFASLGVKVTMIDRFPSPLGFLDPEISKLFVESFERAGGVFEGNGKLKSLEWDGVSSVVAELEDGRRVNAQKAMVAAGRIANIGNLNLEAADLELTPRGHLAVDENLVTTNQKHIYGIGDVIGPPSLAASSMEQGRRAARHALGLPLGHPPEMIPSGIYTLPEISMVGLSEDQARERHGEILVGRAPYSELARSHIAAATTGLLKMITDGKGEKLLGVHIVGGGAAELVHIGQVVMQMGGGPQFFIENIFNFPTMAEAYRVAAFDIARQMKGSYCTTVAPPVQV